MIEYFSKYNIPSVKNVHHLFSAMAILLLMSCAPSVLPVNALQADLNGKPEWVSQKPTNSRYYVGVGYSRKSTSENYVQSAKNNALDDMISEIKVNISSVSVLNQMDNSEGFTEQYESIIKTTTSEEVEDYELVGSWEGTEQYWVYYRLSKAKYKKRKAEKRKNAIAIAKDNYIQGLQHIEQGNITSGITLYINGLYAMGAYLGQSNKTLVKGDSILLGNALYNEIQDAFNEMVISSKKDKYLINRRLDDDEAIDVMVRTKSKNVAVRELPLKASFSVGQGSVHPDYVTDYEGKATVLLSSIRSREAKQMITVMADVDKLVTSEENKRKYGLLLQGLQLPQKELYFQIKKPIIYLESIEKRLGALSNSTQITNKVKQMFSAEGFTLGRIKEKADLWIEVLADTDKGKASGSIYVTYFNLKINVIDMNTGAEIHHAGIDRLKAYSLNYERSSQSGYDKALEVLENKTMPKLIGEILE